jgi:RNA polymerase-binding transcription factor DksA
MQEDILGTRRSVIPSTIFVQCSRCGKPIPRNQAKIVPSTTLSEGNSDFEYICRDCQKAMVAGESDISSEP